MTISYRPITDDEVTEFFQAQSRGFSRDLNLANVERAARIRNLARSTAAFDGERIVGTAGIWEFEMTVPGASLPCAGVTWVSVSPTHRRRGILTAMMRRQLDEIREHGEAIAALWASEAPIYGRFGYGLAAEDTEIRIERTRTALRHVVQWAGSCRFVTRDEALACWPAVYEEARRVTPGMISRSQAWWEVRHFPLVEQPVPGMSGSFRVQYEEQGQVRGYVRYRVKEGYELSSSSAELLVVELVAATDAAYSALWSFVFGVDLIQSIRCDFARVDEPLLHMLEDPRRLIRRTADTIFIRIIDVERALSSRRYAMESELTFALTDAFCPWNDGTYRLVGGPNGAECRRAKGETPDLELDAETLGAVYLGGMRFQALARAGRVRGSEEALRRADLMFAWDPMPWIPEIF